MMTNTYESPADRETRERSEYAARLTHAENERESREQLDEEERMIREEQERLERADVAGVSERV